MDRSGEGERGATSVVGNLLLVGVVIVVGMVLGVLALGLAEDVGGPTPETDVEYEYTSAGLVVRPTYIGQEVEVRLNGETVATFGPDDAGTETLLPTAPGDRVVVVAGESDRKILLSERISRLQASDFIAYYTFERGSGSTLVDRSGNDNDGTISGASWVTTDDGTGLRFDGSDDDVTVSSLSTGSVDVEEFTVAVKYRSDGSTGTVQQLVEHKAPGGEEWFLETAGGSVPYRLDYAVNWPTDTVTTSDTYGAGETHVAVGIYDGSTYRLYVDGDLVGSGSYDRPVNMGDLVIGADAPAHSSQHLWGDVYDLRLYYTAFGPDQVDTLTRSMQAEAE